MKAYRKSDNKEINVDLYYVYGKFAGYVEKKPNGTRRFYNPESITIKEYYGM